MSFILDALKKSESDRQRQSGPSLFEVKVAPPRRSLPVWAVALAILLGINVIVISWMLLRHPATPQPATTGSASTAAPPPAVPTATAPPAGSARPAPAPSPGAAASATAPAASTRQASATAQDSSAAAPAGGGHSSGQPSAGDASGDEAPAGDAAAAPDAGASGSAAQDLPLYQQIVSSAGLPALHLDLHVFAQRPRDRFVMINMHRVGEGDTLPGGVQVDAIRPDGVVLTYHGTQFLLPRN